MVARLEAGGLGFVLGSRFLDSRSRPPMLRRAVLRAAVRHTRLSTGMALTDTHNGLRVLSREAAAALAIRQNRMAHASEIVAQLGRTGLAWCEHPVAHPLHRLRPQEGSVGVQLGEHPDRAAAQITSRVC